MDYYAGIGVSLEQSCVCVVDRNGKSVCETRRRNLRAVAPAARRAAG